MTILSKLRPLVTARATSTVSAARPASLAIAFVNSLWLGLNTLGINIINPPPSP
jgi:hypothetical protein